MHSFFQSVARECLSFDKFSLKICLYYAYFKAYVGKFYRCLGEFGPSKTICCLLQISIYLRSFTAHKMQILCSFQKLWLCKVCVFVYSRCFIVNCSDVINQTVENASLEQAFYKYLCSFHP